MCNYRRWVQVILSTTFVKIMLCCAFKYWSSFVVVVTFLIKTIPHWPPLYASRSYSYYVLKLLPKAKTSWSDSYFPSVINSYFSFLLSPTPLTPTMMIEMVTYLQLWIELLNYLLESMWKNIIINLGWNAGIDNTMVVNSIMMTTCMSPFSKPF
jgi:hypothetical protein